MNKDEIRTAVLIMSRPGEANRGGKERARHLFEKLTCNGFLGPSDIFFLAPPGVKYREDEPSIENIKGVFSSLVERDSIEGRVLIYISSHFSGEGMDLQDGNVMGSAPLSDMIKGIRCSGLDIILDGIGSEAFAPSIAGDGRRVIFSSPIKGEKKEEFMDVNGFVVRNVVDPDRVRNENKRLGSEGVEIRII